MKITDPGTEVLLAATRGDLAALDRLLMAVQPGIYNLAVRVLGKRDDAADATQEILLKVVTHLATFRGDAAFTSWVWRIVHNHLMTARTRSAEAPEVSLEAMAERLKAGLDSDQSPEGSASTAEYASGGSMVGRPEGRKDPVSSIAITGPRLHQCADQHRKFSRGNVKLSNAMASRVRTSSVREVQR